LGWAKEIDENIEMTRIPTNDWLGSLDFDFPSMGRI
jgi:hypothetical protein